MMRAALFDPTMTPSSMRHVTVPRPSLAPNHVRIAVRAVAMSRAWLGTASSPFVPGAMVAGEVLEVDDGVSRTSIGQAVAAFGRSGGLAEEIVMAEAGTLVLPPGVSFVEGTMSADGVAASFVLGDLIEALPAGRLQLVAVGDASGTFGCVMGGLLRELGLATIGVVDDPAGVEVAHAAGYDRVVVASADEPLWTTVLGATDGAGVTGYVDHAAVVSLEDAARMLAAQGCFMRADPLRTRLDPPSEQLGVRLAELGARWMEFDPTATLASRYQQIPAHRTLLFEGLRAGRLVVPVTEIAFDDIDQVLGAIDDPTRCGHLAVTL